MKKIIVVILVVISIFIIGAYAGASSTNLMSDILVDSNKKLSDAVSGNTNVLVTNLDEEVTKRVNVRLEGAINTYSNKANQEVKEYYDQKLEGVALSPQVSNIVVQLDNNTKTFVESEKQKIDNALAELLGQ